MFDIKDADSYCFGFGVAALAESLWIVSVVSVYRHAVGDFLGS